MRRSCAKEWPPRLPSLMASIGTNDLQSQRHLARRRAIAAATVPCPSGTRVSQIPRHRVEAKKILGHTDLYPHLAYANRRGLQIEHLLDGARKNNMLPFCVLYHVMPSMPPVRCSASTRDGANGVFLADAVELYEKWVKASRQRIGGEQLLADSNPLSCMFCCAGAMSARLTPHSLTRYTTTFFKTIPSQLARHYRTPSLALTS